MVAFDANESLTPFEYRRDGQVAGYGSILFDARRVQQVEPGWFDPAWWGDRARPVDSGGRGGAWFVDAPFGQSVLRHYLRGGLAARLSRDGYVWRDADRTRSFAEFRMTRALHSLGLPVPRPIAACYWRGGAGYRAAIMVERLSGVRSLADLAAADPASAPWEETGHLLARFHRAGLDHADLNAHNILFNDGPDPGSRRGWLIDFDKASLRIPETGWRERNLVRLRRSLLKLRGHRSQPEVLQDFARLRHAYDGTWRRGI
jgi:3-deoxy-D-manno-octulosonic acid kinase